MSEYAERDGSIDSEYGQLKVAISDRDKRIAELERLHAEMGAVRLGEALADQKKIAELEAEIERLKAGQFTKDEVQNFCHNLNATVPVEEFARGCATEQYRLYGCAPHADKLADALEENASLRAALSAAEKWRSEHGSF